MTHQRPEIYQHPLAFLVGLEGIALLRAWAGDFDEEFVHARLDEVRRLLEDPALNGPGVQVLRADTQTAYRQWADNYEAELGYQNPFGTAMFGRAERMIQEILDGRSAGVALDAACGTGRVARYLHESGHEVIGVDSSPEMLASARKLLPGVDFREGSLEHLPLPDDSVDVVVTTLALCHVPDLGPVMSEFARVLRPGGDLVISDIHVEHVFRGSVVKAPGPNGEPGLAATYRHQPTDYLRAALAAGLRVRRCEEQVARYADGPAPEPTSDPGPWTGWPWSLGALVPVAMRAGWSTPETIVWHFQWDGEPS
ncbi:class I SAM-dependent methyltransferase [Actinospica robiniae]|uniref:class I SAM-dependent methyltransferase n=1 Tax=Actinospica robiniae TaxID=304901 RepID=UPI0004245282|nr:class I SAM-dependent methyltransferase [Actinospica robiniae]